MANTKNKSWRNSKYKRAYLKAAFIFLAPPQKIYNIAHKNSSSSMREKMIRARLVEMGVLRMGGKNSGGDNFDLENGHI